MPLLSVFTTSKRPISRGAVHVRTAVGLLVEADDVDDADLGDVRRDQADLRADEVRVLEGRVARQELDLDRAVGRDRLVHELLDARREAFGQRIELEVHARFERFHVAAGHRLAPLVPDDAAQHVHRRVRAHQLVAALPVDRARDFVADGRGGSVERVPDVVAVLAHVGDRCARQRPRVVRLPAARRIERGAVERDALAVDFGHGRRELAEVRVAEVQQLGHVATLRPRVTPCRRRTSSWTSRPW